MAGRLGAVMRFGGGYGLSVVISGVLSVAVIPIVILVAGETAWATIAVAQAVGGFGYVLVAAGWGIVGPSEIAALDDSARGQYYRDSFATRMWLFGLALVPVAVIAIVLARADPALAGITVAGGLFAALSAGWFFVGERSPIRYLLLDTLPRNLATVVGAGALLVTGNALWFVVAQLAGGVVSTWLATRDILARYADGAWRWGVLEAFGRLRTQSSAISMAATSAVYVNLPVLIVQIFIPASTAMYALAERILRLSVFATRPFVQVSQGYVPHSDLREQATRAIRVTRLALVLSAAGGLAYALFGPAVSRILSGGTLEMPFDLALPMGVALAAMLSSQITGFACLTAFGLTRVLAKSTLAGAITGACLLVPAAIVYGVVGLAWALALSELVVLVVQLGALRPHLKRARNGADG
ncbi:lipopolysaccharide biosynthesis protein [Agromyces sp. NPDC055520]